MSADDTQVIGTTVQGAATPDQTSAQGTSTEAAAETPVEPKYVTKEELAAAMAEAIRREKQSSRDRMRQVDEKLTAIKARLETGGAQLNQQQVEVLREQVEQDLDSGVPAQTQASVPVTPEMQAQADFVFSQIEETFKDVGTHVLPSDPEYKLIQDVLDDPHGSVAKVIRAAGKAADAKTLRVTEQKSSAAARVISSGQSTQIQSTASSAKSLWDNAYKK